MINPYFFAFYRIYKIIYFIGNRGIPEYSSVSLLSVCLFFNVFTFWDFFANEYNLNLPEINNITGVIIGFTILASNFLIFLRKDNYKRIIQEYDTKYNSKKFLSNLFVLLYIFGSAYLAVYILERYPKAEQPINEKLKILYKLAS
ncbi:MAG: hypothetical protein ACXWDO_09920 [Bacteroidia bacterium]